MSFSAVNLANLPPPQVVELLDAETIFQEMLARLQVLDPAFTALVESDPAIKVLQVAAYREVLIRQKINDQAKACLLAFATGSDLDHLAANLGVARLSGESDDALRQRATLAPEAWSVAGPVGAYRFHAQSAHPSIKDVGVAAHTPAPGSVMVAVLTNSGSGAAVGARINFPAGYADGSTSLAVLPLLADIPAGTILEFEGGATFTLDVEAKVGDEALSGSLAGAVADAERAGPLPFVEDALNADAVRPLCDTVVVQSAEIVDYAIEAQLTLFPGPQAAGVLAAAQESLDLLVSNLHACGRDVTLSAIIAALHVEGVHHVYLIAPDDAIAISPVQAPFCSEITLSVAGRAF